MLQVLVNSLEKKIDETEKKYEEASKLSEERLQQALDAEAKIIELKLNMQRLKSFTYMAWFLQQCWPLILFILLKYGFACRLDMLAVCLKLKFNILSTYPYPCHNMWIKLEKTLLDQSVVKFILVTRVIFVKNQIMDYLWTCIEYQSPI